MSDNQNTPRFSTIGVTYTKHQNNAALSMSSAEDSTMRRLGFTDHREGYWYLCRSVSPDHDMTLNVEIAKDGSDWQIDVLDENFCQPYDYQYLLNVNPTLDYPNKVADECENGSGNYPNGVCYTAGMRECTSEKTERKNKKMSILNEELEERYPIEEGDFITLTREQLALQLRRAYKAGATRDYKRTPHGHTELLKIIGTLQDSHLLPDGTDFEDVVRTVLDGRVKAITK